MAPPPLPPTVFLGSSSGKAIVVLGEVLGQLSLWLKTAPKPVQVRRQWPWRHVHLPSATLSDSVSELNDPMKSLS